MDAKENLAAGRLAVAADYNPEECGGREGAKKEALNLADELAGMDLYFKVNSLLRSCGYDLIKEIHDRGLKVMADLKLIDISETLKIDAAFLNELKPELVTVMCFAGAKGLTLFKEKICPEVSVIGVTVLTSLNDADCDTIFTCTSQDAVLRLAKLAKTAGVEELVLSGKEQLLLKGYPELAVLSQNIPAIRPGWAIVEGDDQSRIVTPGMAIQNGAKRIIVGRPITQAKNPREAVLRTLEEVEIAVRNLSHSTERN